MFSPLNFKIVAVGQSATGKTSLIYKYIKGEFRLDYNVTLGVQFYTKTQKVGQEPIQLQIWDTAGQEAYRSIVKTFYKGSAAVLMVFALNDARSFQELRYWFKELKENVHPETLIFLIGTKMDLEGREVSAEKVKEFVEQSGSLIYYETSSKTGENVEKLFTNMGAELVKKYNANKSFRQLVNPNDERLRGYVGNSPQPYYPDNPVRATRVIRTTQPVYNQNCC